MRLLITFGYQSVLFGPETNTGPIIAALSDAVLVEEEGPWDHRVYAAKDKTEIGVKLIGDGDVRLPDVPRAVDLDKLLAIAKERDELKTKVYTLEQQLKKITETVTPKA
jgi:hypothetical protein